MITAEQMEELMKDVDKTHPPVMPRFVHYRDPKDDRIAIAIQNAAAKLRAEGKTLFGRVLDLPRSDKD